MAYEAFWVERKRISLSAQVGCRERQDCRLVAEAVREPAVLRLWSLLPLSAQRERRSLETQARVPDLPGVGAKPADQAEEAADGARVDQYGVVNVLHA